MPTPPPKLPLKIQLLRIAALLSAGTMVTGFVLYSQNHGLFKRARSTKSTQILEDLRQIDATIEQSKALAPANQPVTIAPGSKSAKITLLPPTAANAAPPVPAQAPAPNSTPPPKLFPGSKTMIHVVPEELLAPGKLPGLEIKDGPLPLQPAGPAPFPPAPGP